MELHHSECDKRINLCLKRDDGASEETENDIPKIWRDKLSRVDVQPLLPLPNGETARASGLLPKSNCIWIASDSALYLWNLKERVLAQVLDISSHPVKLVTEVNVNPRVVMGLSTTALAIVGDTEFAVADCSYRGYVRLSNAKVRLEGVAVTSVASSIDGRIFLGATDGHVYEFKYDWRDCRLVKHANSNFAQSLYGRVVGAIIPGAASAVAASAPIAALVVDSAKGCVIAARSDGSLAVLQARVSKSELDATYYRYREELPPSARLVKEIPAPVLRAAIQQYCIDNPSSADPTAGIAEVLSLDAVSVQEQDQVRLVLTYRDAVRVHVSLPVRRLFRLGEPRVTAVHKGGSAAAGEEAVCASWLGDRALLALRGGGGDRSSSDTLVALLTTDPHESVQLFSAGQDHIVGIAEKPLVGAETREEGWLHEQLSRSWDGKLLTKTSIKASEVSWQHLPCATAALQRRILVLTDRCLCTLHLQRPSDVLHAILTASSVTTATGTGEMETTTGREEAYRRLDAEVGAVEAAATLVGLACGLPVDAGGPGATGAALQESGKEGAVEMLRSCVPEDVACEAVYTVCSRILRPVWLHPLMFYCSEIGCVATYLGHLDALMGTLQREDLAALREFCADALSAVVLVGQFMEGCLIASNTRRTTLQETTLQLLVTSPEVRGKVCQDMFDRFKATFARTLRAETMERARAAAEAIVAQCAGFMEGTALARLQDIIPAMPAADERTAPFTLRADSASLPRDQGPVFTLRHLN